MAAIATEDLAPLLQSLPQEIYDEIYELTFSATCTTPNTIEIDTKHYSPPSILQVDTASRRLAALTYYSSHTFVAYDQKVLDAWLCSIARKHMDDLREVHLVNILSEEAIENWTRGRFNLAGPLYSYECMPRFCSRWSQAETLNLPWLKMAWRTDRGIQDDSVLWYNARIEEW